MHLALVLTFLLLSNDAMALSATEASNYPFPPAAQACLDHIPSASKDPQGFLQCLDIGEVAAADRWKALYEAKHPATKVCRESPPLPSDPSLTSLCFTVLDQEATAYAHMKEMVGMKMNLLRKRITERAAQRAARIQLPQVRMPTLEELDTEIEQLEEYGAFMSRPVLPTTPGGATDWLFYSTPHGLYTNLGDGWMMRPGGGLYVPY